MHDIFVAAGVDTYQAVLTNFIFTFICKLPISQNEIISVLSNITPLSNQWWKTTQGTFPSELELARLTHNYCSQWKVTTVIQHQCVWEKTDTLSLGVGHLHKLISRWRNDKEIWGGVKAERRGMSDTEKAEKKKWGGNRVTGDHCITATKRCLAPWHVLATALWRGSSHSSLKEVPICDCC